MPKRSAVCSTGNAMSAEREAQKFFRDLRRQGFETAKTNGGHVRISHPDLSGPVFAPSTPGDGQRGRKNVLAKLRRMMRDRRT